MILMFLFLQNPHTNETTINKMFIERFHALYLLQIGKSKTIALFDMGTSINAISSTSFFRSLHQQLKLMPTNRNVVSTDGDSLGPIVEVYLKFQLGKVIFNDRFVILINLKSKHHLRFTLAK